MTEEKMNPPCKCMVEDMRIRGMSNKRQRLHIHIWAIKDYGIFLSHSPDTATPEELRACQLHLTDSGVTPTIFNTHLDWHFCGASFFKSNVNTAPNLRSDTKYVDLGCRNFYILCLIVAVAPR